MAVIQPPDQLEELEHTDEILLRELQRMDELLLQELERVDEMLLRIVAGIDQLPKRVASAIGREQLGSPPGNRTRASESARGAASTRPFDPYPEDEAEVAPAEDKYSSVAQMARKVQSRIAAYAQGDALRAATLSLAAALLATAIAVIGLIVAVSH
jgi:hypothetical protein